MAGTGETEVTNPSWRESMRRAADLRRAGRSGAALAHCEAALAAVDGWLGGATVDAPTLMAKVAAHQLQAALLGGLGRGIEAERAHLAAHAFARHVADDGALPDSLRRTACCLSRVTGAELRCFRAERLAGAPVPVVAGERREAPRVVH